MRVDGQTYLGIYPRVETKAGERNVCRKYISKLLKENVQKVSRPICYWGLIVTYLQVYHEKSQIKFSIPTILLDRQY